MDTRSGELYTSQGDDPAAAVDEIGPWKIELFQMVAQLEEEAFRQTVEALQAEGVLRLVPRPLLRRGQSYPWPK